jgi:hypothetical protein
MWSQPAATRAAVEEQRDSDGKSDNGVSRLATTGPKPEPISAPAPEAITESIQRGVAFLLADQRPDGSWGSPEHTKSLNIYAPAPGAHDAFRTAVTSLVLSALIESSHRLPEEQSAAAGKAIDGGEAWLVQRLGRLRRAAPDPPTSQNAWGHSPSHALYNVWGHAFSIQALVDLHGRADGDEDRQARLRDLAAGQAEMLRRYEFVNGGWGYYDLLAGTQKPSDSPNCFITATALIALHEAKQQLGIEFPAKLVERAIESIRRQRRPDFSYVYGEYLRLEPMQPINRPAGSLGRSQVCNLALRLYGDERVTDEVITTWLNRLYARNGWLGIARKRPIPHDSDFGVAGYFYYYGHYYAAMCIEQLPDDRRPYFKEHLAHILLPLQEKDGTWWDFPFYNYHQQYGTAMAVSSLVRCL